MVKLSFDEGKKEDFEQNLENLSNTLGVDKDIISNIISNQKNNLVELTHQYSKKKETKLKKIGKVLGKMAIYGGIGIGLTALTGPLGGGISLGVARLVETFFRNKKLKKDYVEAERKTQELLLKEREGEEALKEDDSILDNFYNNIFIELSLAKQNQIEGKEKEFNELGKKIAKAENEHKSKDKISIQELKELYKLKREAHKEQIKRYLEAHGLEGEELELRVKLSVQLVELEDNQKILELDFVKRKVGKIGKFFAGIDKFLNNSYLLGSSAKGIDNQIKDKITTAGIFAVAGALARACPLVRNILMAYAGMKLGSAAADFMFGKAKILKQVSAESINLKSSIDDIGRAKAQLLDPKYKENNPIEYAKLQEKIFAIDRAKMEKALGGPEGDADGGYIGETNKKLEETIKKRRAAQGAHKGMKIFWGVAGGAIGWFVGEYMNNQSKNRAEQIKRQEDLARDHEARMEKVAIAQEEERQDILAKAERDARLELEAKMRAQTIKGEAQEKIDKIGKIWLGKKRMIDERMAELRELNKSVTVEKGDTVWKLTEEQLKERMKGNWDDLGRAEKDYMIDLYKDKVVADPSLIGIEGDNASALQIGDELNFSKAFSDPNEMTMAMVKAKGLDAEEIGNIMNNREIIGDVMNQKLESVSGDKLIKAMNIMGKNPGAGFVQEFNERATEIVGDNITPEQTQTILSNPDVFSKIMDAGNDLEDVDNNTLGEALRLFNDTESVGNNFVKEITEMDSPLAEEFSERAKDVWGNIKDKFGDIYHPEHDDSGIANIYDTDPLAIQTEEALENSQNLIKQGQNIQGLIGNSDSWIQRNILGIEGRIGRLNGLFKESVNDYEGFVNKYNSLLKDGQNYGKTWFELTGDKGLLRNYFQSDYLKNNEIKIEKNIKNLAKIIKEIKAHFAPPDAYPGAH